MDRHNREIFAITSVAIITVDIIKEDSDYADGVGSGPDGIGVEAFDIIRRLMTAGPHDELPAFADTGTDDAVRERL